MISLLDKHFLHFPLHWSTKQVSFTTCLSDFPSTQWHCQTYIKWIQCVFLEQIFRLLLRFLVVAWASFETLGTVFLIFNHKWNITNKVKTALDICVLIIVKLCLRKTPDYHRNVRGKFNKLISFEDWLSNLTNGKSKFKLTACKLYDIW